MTLHYQIVPVTVFQQNSTLLWCDETRQAAIVDPGGDLPRILAAIEKNALVPEKILITHGHVDHAAGAKELADTLGIPIEGPHEDDSFWLEAMPRQAREFGFPGDPQIFSPDRWLKDRDTVCFGRITMRVIHCPGHTPGHVVFYHAPTSLALVGDVLFADSIGRTDLPGGDFDALLASIRNKLWPLGDDVNFIPGHGPMSRFGLERESNPFCGDSA